VGGWHFLGLTVPFLSKFVGAFYDVAVLGLLSLIPMFIAIYAMPKITIKRYLQSADVKGIKKEIILTWCFLLFGRICIYYYRDIYLCHYVTCHRVNYAFRVCMGICRSRSSFHYTILDGSA